jgi:hypothetical protein
MDSLTDDLDGGHRLMDIENLRKVKKLAILVEKRQLEEPELATVLEAFGNVEELSPGGGSSPRCWRRERTFHH